MRVPAPRPLRHQPALPLHAGPTSTLPSFPRCPPQPGLQVQGWGGVGTDTVRRGQAQPDPPSWHRSRGTAQGGRGWQRGKAQPPWRVRPCQEDAKPPPHPRRTRAGHPVPWHGRVSGVPRPCSSHWSASKGLGFQLPSCLKARPYLVIEPVPRVSEATQTRPGQAHSKSVNSVLETTPRSARKTRHPPATAGKPRSGSRCE